MANGPAIQSHLPQHIHYLHEYRAERQAALHAIELLLANLPAQP